MDLNLNLDTDFDKPIKPQKKRKQKKGSSNFLVFLIVAGIAAYGGWLYYQKTELLTEITRIQSSISTLETQITDSQNDDEKHNFVSPDLTLKAIDERTEWSELILAIKALETGEVTFSNFTVTAEGSTSITGTARSLTAVKNLLTRLQDNPQVIDPFIPNIELNEKIGPGRANVQFEILFNFIPN
jgi:hypothetical protein